MVNLRRVQFNRARVSQLIRDHQDKKKLPSWAQDVQIRQNKLYIGDLEVVPREDVEEWLRSRIYSTKPISLSRDSGYTDYIARETLGISRRAFYSFLSAQDIHQRLASRPKPAKVGGRRVYKKGIVQIDLVEHKKTDTGRADGYIFTMVDRLSSYLVPPKRNAVRSSCSESWFRRWRLQSVQK